MWCKILLFSFAFSRFFFLNFVHCTSNACDSKAIFTINQNSNKSSVWTNGTTLASYGCNNSSNITIILHGWGGVGAWVPAMEQKFLQFRGGCVIYFNYSACVDMANYGVSLELWPSASAVLTEKLREIENEGFSPANFSLYGFSLGARIVVDGAINYNNGTLKVGLLYACDAANDGFDYIYTKDPKTAAQNVQCIHTSYYFGTAIRNQCHQDWLMGNCGNTQPGANDLLPFTDAGSHGMCNTIFMCAFDNDFLANNVNKCSGVNPSTSTPAGLKMGVRENTQARGVFASPTYKNYPYNS